MNCDGARRRRLGGVAESTLLGKQRNVLRLQFSQNFPYIRRSNSLCSLLPFMKQADISSDQINTLLEATGNTDVAAFYPIIFSNFLTTDKITQMIVSPVTGGGGGSGGGGGGGGDGGGDEAAAEKEEVVEEEAPPATVS